ncbi:MAG: hypothetical protein KME11_03155 [Timaviella obliquedivisa GSE-PSE-MK23-08B]|jgi:hypothetical protein|nr:hypothetical protein [Timaviella obliquedivisa GSE-PSE-MK23-08B]MBW4514206.1 hypothetical protein [Timaviella obliquedivisa GSE-PSE-MK23-08B]
MNTQTSGFIQQHFNELEDEVRTLAVKHNYLVESISLLWSEIQRTTTDPLTRQRCERRIGELNLLLHDIEPKPENLTPTSGQVSPDGIPF